MSAVPRTKRSRSHVVAPGDGSVGRRKDDDIQLHDEADLVNFRADAYTRFLDNQDQLENVTSKPFHTASIAPPSSFPVHTKKKYAPMASDAEVEETLAKMGPEELFMGDRRLMEAKMRVSARELADAKEELSKQTPEAVFGAEFTEKRNAIQQLARLQGECSSAEAVAALEEAARQISASGNYVFGSGSHRQFSIPVEQLAPDMEVATAPPSYNPRSISTFIDIGNPADEFLMMDGLKESSNSAEANMGGRNTAFAPGSSDDFVFDAATKPIPAGAGGAVDEDLNMDELNDLFVDPNANERMDEMDALMNFDQDNDAGLMNDDAFNSAFLS